MWEEGNPAAAHRGQGAGRGAAAAGTCPTPVHHVVGSQMWAAIGLKLGENPDTKQATNHSYGCALFSALEVAQESAGSCHSRRR